MSERMIPDEERKLLEEYAASRNISADAPWQELLANTIAQAKRFKRIMELQNIRAYGRKTWKQGQEKAHGDNTL